MRYQFFQKHFPSFTTDLPSRPRISPSSTEQLHFQPGSYSLNCRGLRRWNGEVWDVIRVFDELDLLISFPLREISVYFSILGSSVP